MMFLRKQSQDKVESVDEKKTEIKLTKKERLKQKKLERKEKMLEKRRNLLKQHLARELKYGVLTLKKHEENWKRMLTHMTLPYQKEKLEFTWQMFERLMDAKDFIISRLLDELRQQEDQYLTNIRMHVTTVDRIIGMFNEQLQELHDSFFSELQSLECQHREFLNSMLTSSGDSIHHLKAMIYGMEMEDKTRERNLRADVCAKVEFETYDNRGATMEMTERLSLIFHNMLNYTNEVINKFLKKSRQRRLGYDNIKIADDKVQDLLSIELNKIQNLNVLIRKLKKKEEGIGHNELANLEGDKEFFKRSFLIMKLKLADDLKLDKTKQEFFISEFHKAHENMKKFLKRGENMMFLLRATKKLETLKEKVQPYPICRETLDNTNNTKENKLFLLWQRVANVNSSRTALIERRNSLLMENNWLRRQIEDMCYCLSCPKLPPICRREGSIPFTDGVTLMRKYESHKGGKRR